MSNGLGKSLSRIQFNTTQNLYNKFLEDQPTFVSPKLRNSLKSNLTSSFYQKLHLNLQPNDLALKKEKLRIIYDARKRVMSHYNFKDVHEIRKAVREGRTICQGQSNYVVTYSKEINTYYIVCTNNDWTVGLTFKDTDGLIENLQSFL